MSRSVEEVHFRVDEDAIRSTQLVRPVQVLGSLMTVASSLTSKDSVVYLAIDTPV